MKLTQNHIQELYKFTRKHYVEHYDVQTELVDHLANDIEEIWLAKPNLSFEDARNKAFKKFGVFGFMNVVEAKQKAMTKKYWKILVKFVKQWFVLPKIIATSLIFMVFYMVLQTPISKEIIMSTILLVFVYQTYVGFRIRKNKKKEKLFLLEEMIEKTKTSYTIFTLMNVFNIVNLTRLNFEELSVYWLIFIALFATIFSITVYITSVVIPNKAEDMLQEMYPEYKII